MRMVVVVAVATACGGGGETEVDAGAPPDVALSTVRGTRTLDSHSQSEVTSQPVDLQNTAVVAWVLGADGMYRSIDGTGTVDGDFSIDGVPEELVHVQLDDAYAGTSERDVDFGRDYTGRRGSATGLVGASFTFNLDNLRAWRDNDVLLYYSANTGLWLMYFENYAAVEPVVGEAALSGFTVDWQGWPLVDSTQGDRASVVQYEALTLGGEYVTHPIRVYHAPSFLQESGSDTTLTGSFEEILQTESLSLEWNVAADISHANAVYPEARAGLGEATLSVQPGGINPMFFFQRPSLVEFPFVFSTGALDLDIPYGNPFPAEWPLFVTASMFFTTDYQLPDLMPGPIFAHMGTVVDLESYTGTIAVELSPVRTIFFSGLSEPDETPTVSWSPPTIGVPTSYRVDVLRLFDNGGETDNQLMASLTTTETELAIPPGILIEGETYVFRIAAIRSPNLDMASHPHRTPIPMAFAEALSRPILL